MESGLHRCFHFPTSVPFPKFPPPHFVPPNAPRAHRPTVTVTSAITSAAGCGTGRLLLGPGAPSHPKSPTQSVLQELRAVWSRAAELSAIRACPAARLLSFCCCCCPVCAAPAPLSVPCSSRHWLSGPSRGRWAHMASICCRIWFLYNVCFYPSVLRVISGQNLLGWSHPNPIARRCLPSPRPTFCAPHHGDGTPHPRLSLSQKVPFSHRIWAGDEAAPRSGAAASAHQRAPSCQIPLKPQTAPIWGCPTLRPPHPTGAARAQLWIRQSPAQLWVRPGRTAELNCSTDSGWNVDRHRTVSWYREQPGSRLQFIYPSPDSSRSEGKYSQMRRAKGLFSFYINSAQREDSGFYYCASTSEPFEFGDGTRLVVTGEHWDIAGTKGARGEGEVMGTLRPSWGH